MWLVAIVLSSTILDVITNYQNFPSESALAFFKDIK